MVFRNINIGKSKSFTLVELLVVMALIGILAGIILVALSGAIIKANDTRIIEEIGHIRSAAALYYSDKNYKYVGLDSDTDNPAMRPLLDDIIDRGGTNLLVNPNNSTGQAYCVEVQLNSGDWWCVDSQGRSARYDASTIPTEPACDDTLGSEVYTCE